jgi:exonuclease VII large subunit
MGRFLIAILGLTAILAANPAAGFEFPSLRQPTWQELSPQQKQILEPLGPEWDQMDDARRKKWVGIAARYPHLTQDEQARIQEQMPKWSKLTPQQKLVIRQKYKAFREAPPDKRQSLREQWERYQQLPPEERQRLQEEAERRKEEERKRLAQEKSRQATSVLSAKVLKPGYPLVPIQQAPAPVITLTPLTPAPPLPEPTPAPQPESASAVTATPQP